MTRLYEIPREIEMFEHRLIQNDGEITPEMEQEWSELVAGSKERLEAAAFVITQLDDEAESCRDEVKRLQGRARSTENNRKRLADLTLYALRAMGGKVKTALVTLYIGRTGNQISVETKEGTDLAEVQKSHPDFVRVKYEPNLEAIKTAYLAANNLPECFIVRHQEGTEYLRIK